MTVMQGSRAVRQRVVGAVGAVLVLAVLTSCAGSDDSRSSVVPVASAPDGWKTVEYRGVQVDIPTGWTRSDVENCEFPFERWTPPSQPACSPDGGVAFYVSATFDPLHGPGVRRDDTGKDVPAWAGYVYAGDYAVYVADDDRGLVQQVLSSADATADQSDDATVR
jgi:hypothetical protein